MWGSHQWDDAELRSQRPQTGAPAIAPQWHDVLHLLTQRDFLGGKSNFPRAWKRARADTASGVCVTRGDAAALPRDHLFLALAPIAGADSHVK